MRSGQAVSDLDGVAQGLTQLESATADQAFQGVAAHELHHDHVTIAFACDVVDGDDVGVLECGGGAGLLLESAAALRVGQAVRWEDLQGDVAVQTRVMGPVHDAHAALADLFEDPEPAERLAEHGGSPRPMIDPSANRRYYTERQFS